MYPSCQEDIIAELKRRIDAGDYTEMLPPASQLAGEFRVNVKTMNKALNRLAAAGVVERRKRFGTAVRPSGGRGRRGAHDRSRLFRFHRSVPAPVLERSA